MAFARANGIVLHHRVSGRDGAPWVVFANSLGTDFRIWDEVAEALGDRYRILCYDKRGHGLSEATPSPYRLDNHVGDLEALLAHVGVTRAVLVGLSVGGLIVQSLAARRPDLAAGIVLADTGHKIGTAEMWNARIETVQTKGIAAMADAIMERWFTPAYRSADNPDFTGYLAMLTRTPAEGYAGTCAALRDADLTESTRGLKLPALLIVGDRDGATPPDLVRSTADLIEDSRFEIIADAGHIPCVEKPAETIALIGGFLEQIADKEWRR